MTAVRAAMGEILIGAIEVPVTIQPTNKVDTRGLDTVREGNRRMTHLAAHNTRPDVPLEAQGVGITSIAARRGIRLAISSPICPKILGLSPVAG
jgi:hypothetical protein